MRSETAWEVVELSQICTYRQERIEVDKLTTSNYISTANMLPNKSGIEVADNLPNTKTTSRFYVNDVLVSNIRPYFKKAWLATLDGGCSNDVLVMRALDDVYAPYLYYLLSSDQFFAYMTSTAKGTKMPRGDKDAIMRYMIQKPPLGVQKAIADILSCLDSKIELNNKINENLEAQVQAIFKSWFVYFEPFQDGEFVESELGLIPEGWVVSSVKGVSKEVVTGKTPRTSDQENYGNHMMFITIPDMRDNVFIIQSERYLSKRGVATQPNKTLPANSILVSCIATAGLVSLTSEHSQTNQQINAIIPKEGISPYFLYSYMKTLSDHIINLGSGGTTTVNLNKGQFSNIKLIIPSPEVMERFHYSISPLFLKIKQNQRESTNLAILRDTLLPKLMSGEIEVPVD